MKKGKTRATAVIILLILVLAVTGCTGGSGSSIDADGNVVLEFWSIYPEGDTNYEWMLSVIDRFEKQNEGIKVNYTGISFWDYFTKITTAMTDPTGPDVYIQTIKDTGDRARGGVSMNLSPFFSESFHAGSELFFPQDVEPMTYEGNVYGIPYALDNRVLYYNIDIVNQLKDTTDEDWLNTKAGQKENTTITGKPEDLIDGNGNVRAPETYDELMAYQELLTVTESGQITQLGFDVNVGNFMFVNVVWSLGGTFFDESGNPVVESNEGVRSGLAVWYEMTHTLSSARVNAFLDTAADNTTNLFWAGKVGMMVATNEIPWQNDKLGDQAIHLGAASVPYNRVEENHYCFTGGFSLEAAKRLEKEDKRVREAAVKLIEFLTSPEIQMEVLTESSNMPANVQVYDTLFGQIKDPAKRVVLSEMSYRRPYDYIYNAPNWFGEVENSLTDFISDKNDLEKTLQQIQSKIERLQQTY